MRTGKFLYVCMTCVEEKKLIRLSCISQLCDFPLLSEAQNFMYGLKAATTEANVQRLEMEQQPQ
jgi:hypothetical protein